MVRLPSSSDALTGGSPVERPSPSANRYALPLSEEASSQRTCTASPVSLHSGQLAAVAAAGVGPAAAAAASPPTPAVAVPVVTAESARPAHLTSSLLSKKTYGPVPSAPILRAASPTGSGSDSPPPTNIRQSTASVHPSGVAYTHMSGDGPQGGFRSPTKTPPRASTPPTSRAAQVPALNLSSVSLHGSREIPLRSASPSAHRTTQKNSTTKDFRDVQSSAADAVVVGDRTRQSSSSGLQAAGLSPAAQAPTQKTIPVVRLVPAAPSDSVEVALHDRMEAADVDSNDSAPTFTNVDVNSGRAYSDAPLMKTQPACRPSELRSASDASYSVEAQPFEDEDDADDEETPDELNAGVYEVWRGDSCGSLKEDVDVDEGSSSSHGSRASLHHGLGGDPIMEDVLTDDNVAQAALFQSDLGGGYTADRTTLQLQQHHQPPSADSFVEEVSGLQERRDVYDDYGVEDEDEEEEEGNQRIYLSEEALARLHSADDLDGRGTAEKRAYIKQPPPVAPTDKDASVSGDYSYYSYSYSDGNDDEDEAKRAEGSDRRGGGGASTSMEALDVPPPMAASINATLSVAAAASETRDDVVSQDAHSPEKKGKGKKGRGQGERSPAAASAMPAVLRTPLTGTEEVGSMQQTHDESFQSNVSNTMKKAGGVFKSLFKGKKK